MRPRRPGGGSGPRARRRAIEASEPAWAEFRHDPAVAAAVALSEYSAAVDQAIDVEARISRFLPFWADQSANFDLAGVDALAEGVVAELEDMADTPALTTLRGLAAVADPWLGEPSAAAAERLTTNGVLAPLWADEIGRAEATGALCMTDPAETDEIGVLIEFEYPSGDRHAIATYIVPRLGGIAKHVFLCKPSEAITGAGQAFDEIDLGDARERMRDALRITPPDGVPGGEGHFELGALAWSRVRA